MSSDSGRQRELEESVAEATQFLSGQARRSTDPEVIERVALAHYKRARALRQLGRHGESLADWDRFLGPWAQLHPVPEGIRRVRLAVALAHKSESLWHVGRGGESVLLEAEIAERFADDSDPTIRWFVMMSLIRRAQKLLAQPDSLSEALALSEQLIARFTEDPEERLGGSAQALLSHARHLLSFHGGGVSDLVCSTAEMALNTGTVTAGVLVPRLQARVDISALDALMRRSQRLTPPVIRRHRRRANQGRAVIYAVLFRLDHAEAPDLQAIAVQARYLAAGVTAFSGRPAEGFRAMMEIWDGHDQPTVQALSDLADYESGKGGWIAQINSASLLAQRARSLVGEDPALARLAYDDSVAARLPERLSPVVRLAVRLMRPRLAASTSER